MKYIAPVVFAKSFTCPHYGAIAQQAWWARAWNDINYGDLQYDQIRIGYCTHCQKNTLWIGKELYYPNTGTAPTPNAEMPKHIKEIYEEAASIVNKSPRAAAALLRLGIQLLCAHLGEKGKDINNDIASLVQKGLPLVVQQSLDVVRVTGNDAVHPGVIDTDDPTVVASLFDLTNIIVEYMIAMPKKVSGIYTQLPSTKLDAIKKRDGSP
jgi:hypothetical protein